VVRISPTYSGCPALDTIREDVGNALRSSGFREVRVDTVLSPAWTTDDISARGKEALAEHGIAPPGAVVLKLSAPLSCPRCGSRDTEETSRFGATACKALWRCRACTEPFESFKPH
jgi:ring-1,2-phenylacetyl-CoA epoxidase subunit PaaD